MDIAYIFGFERAINFATGFNRWLVRHFDNKTVEKNLIAINPQDKTVTVVLTNIIFINYCHGLEIYPHNIKPEIYEIVLEVSRTELAYWIRNEDLTQF